MVKIVITGFRGTGKTSVGRELAHRLSLPFYDTDTLIEEKEGTLIPEIFRVHGEAYFRACERAAIAGLSSVRDAVIATGGGAILDAANVEHLRRGAHVFLLTADSDIIAERTAPGTRPPLTDLPLHDEIEHLLGQRMPAYIRAADFCIDTGSESVGRVCDAIMRHLSGRGIGDDDRREGLSLLRRLPVPPGDMQELERIVESGSLTRICGIVGNPCMHSRSPVMYNRLFAHYELPCFYTFLEWGDLSEVIRLADHLDFRGLSITIPFKQEVIRHLDEISEDAAAIGAVNTVVRCGGRMYGYNTDWVGVREPVRHLRGSRALILGAGGVAAAAVYALHDLEMEVTMMNRTPEKARLMAERFGCRWMPWGEFDPDGIDLIINATSVGMEPDTGTPLKRHQLREGMTVFDLVYTPPQTPLLRLAEEAGCTPIPGTDLFVYQACEQFRLFTGIEAAPGFVRGLII